MATAGPVVLAGIPQCKRLFQMRLHCIGTHRACGPESGRGDLQKTGRWALQVLLRSLKLTIYEPLTYPVQVPDPQAEICLQATVRQGPLDLRAHAVRQVCPRGNADD